MSGAPTTTAVPVLPVSDVVRSVAWYERLGFVVNASFPGYAIVAFDGAELHLAEFTDLPPVDATFSGAYLRVADADAVHARWSAMGARTIAAPADQPYGIREFATEDLDGNLWRVGSPIAVEGQAEPEPAAQPAPEAATEAGLDPEPTSATSTSAPGSAFVDSVDWFELVESGATCAACGMAVDDLPARALGAEVRDVAHRLGELLLGADDDHVRRRPEDRTWSALEYGVHVRDLLTVFAERIVLTLAQHEPELGWWDHEAAIVESMANESDVGAVADDLGRNASKLSEALRQVGDDDWIRAATRRGTERFTIELMARFTLHEVVHHTHDAAQSLAATA